jgi:hypothetical protein
VSQVGLHPLQTTPNAGPGVADQLCATLIKLPSSERNHCDVCQTPRPAPPEGAVSRSEPFPAPPWRVEPSQLRPTDEGPRAITSSRQTRRRTSQRRDAAGVPACDPTFAGGGGALQQPGPRRPSVAFALPSTERPDRRRRGDASGRACVRVRHTRRRGRRRPPRMGSRPGPSLAGADGRTPATRAGRGSTGCSGRAVVVIARPRDPDRVERRAVGCQRAAIRVARRLADVASPARLSPIVADVMNAFGTGCDPWRTRCRRSRSRTVDRCRHPPAMITNDEPVYDQFLMSRCATPRDVGRTPCRRHQRDDERGAPDARVRMGVPPYRRPRMGAQATTARGARPATVRCPTSPERTKGVPCRTRRTVSRRFPTRVPAPRRHDGRGGTGPGCHLAARSDDGNGRPPRQQPHRGRLQLAPRTTRSLAITDDNPAMR